MLPVEAYLLRREEHEAYHKTYHELTESGVAVERIRALPVIEEEKQEWIKERGPDFGTVQRFPDYWLILIVGPLKRDYMREYDSTLMSEIFHIFEQLLKLQQGALDFGITDSYLERGDEP